MKPHDINVDKNKLRLANRPEITKDAVLVTKPIGFFKDALIRFSKNKSSVAAAIIILLLILFSIIAPFVSPYDLQHKEMKYMDKLPVIPAFKEAGIHFWDGANVDDYSAASYYNLRAIGLETGLNPIVKIVDEYEVVEKLGTKETVYTKYDLRVDSYLAVGVIDANLTVIEYSAIQDYQDRTGKQLLYPLVDTRKLDDVGVKANRGNFWYEINSKSQPVFDENNDFKPIYLKKDNPADNTDNYYSSRPSFDDGLMIYGRQNTSGYAVRICVYEFYYYTYGRVPSYLFGTNTYGQDVFNMLGMAARFSLILAIVVAAINLTIGAFIGATEGYFGGWYDLVMERITDVLYNIPFIVVVTLFQLHLAKYAGVLGSMLLAFVATGWIGMASLTRKQFYRFKNQEYIMAARTLGAGHSRLMFKHIFPNSLGTLITSCVLYIPGVIGTEVILTYLGIVGLSSSNLTSIGVMLSLGRNSMNSAPHVLLFPSIFVALLMICFNLFGNGLRDAFNPSLRGAE